MSVIVWLIDVLDAIRPIAKMIIVIGTIIYFFKFEKLKEKGEYEEAVLTGIEVIFGMLISLCA